MKVSLIKGNRYLLIACFLLSIILQPLIPETQAHAASKINWSQPKSATYSPLYSGIIAYNYELAFGGLDLSTMTLTTKEEDADFVMNSTQIGARSLLLLNEELETATTPPSSGFNSVALLEVDSVYLITLHDNSFAKIRIDRMSNSAISFSYVLETATASPVPTKPLNDLPKSNPLIILSLTSKQAFINGQSLTLDNAQMPRLVNGRTMVPLRFISESLGAQLDWNNQEQKISLSLNGASLQLWLGKQYALMNGQAITLDVPPQRIGNTTFVPLRFISEKLQQQINFDSSTSTITINGTEGAKGSAETTVVPNQTEKPPVKQPKEIDISPLIGSYSLFVPGGAYSSDNYATNTRTDTVFSGAFDGTLTIKRDGTFQFADSTYNWNSATSSYTAGSGTWSKTGDSDYPILMKDSKTGAQYKIGKSLPKDGGDIYVWQVGSTWEIGTRK